MTLENKLGLTNSLELAKQEEKLSKEKAKRLFGENLLADKVAGRFDTLAFIHRFLFEDIYDFASQVRQVNMAKSNFRFAPVMYLHQSLATVDEIIDKYVEMNFAHPFREGNGRATRIWLDHIFKIQIGQVVDWSRVDKEDYLLAMERSPIRATEIKHVLKQALTNEVNSSAIYLKGIDHSYYYEGYTLYKTEDL